MSITTDKIVIELAGKDDPDLKRIISILNNDGVIGYPTETVYGLGGNGLSADVYKRISELKNRPAGMPFLLLLASTEMLLDLTDDISRAAEDLIDQFWPGPLTLIFRAGENSPVHLKNINGKVGVRISSDPVCNAILSRYSKPLISTSANLSGAEPARSYERVFRDFSGEIDAIIDGGPRTLCEVSTILDVTDDKVLLVRQGSVNISKIEDILGYKLIC